MNELPWTSYSRYLHERFGCEVHRVAVDAGFSCPNRQGGRGAGGCSYCGADASRSAALGQEGAAGALRGQILGSVAHMRARHPGASFILYFQAFTCTNAPAADLARLYGEGLACGDFVGLQVATRPDCMDGEKARMLASFRERGLEVWVELGLQTANDLTLRRVARGHTAGDFTRACGQLKEAGLKTAVHLILGLPGETEEEAAATARFVAARDPDGVKIHNLHIPRGSRLFREYLAGEVTAPGPERHLQCTLRVLELLPPRTLVMRLTTDTPEAELAAPRGFWQKSLFIDRLASAMRARGTWQGRLHGTA
jgi:uncharacterized protein